jgi:hypothetical protein
VGVDRRAGKRSAVRDSGVRDDGVDPAECRHRAADRVVQCRLVGHVGLEPDVARPKGARALLQEVGLEPDERDSRVARGEDRGQLEAKATGSARDEDSLAGEAPSSELDGHGSQLAACAANWASSAG